MKITIDPTQEMFDTVINGVSVPTRVWVGNTDSGIEIEAYILSIVPKNEADGQKFKEEASKFLKPSREVYDINSETPAEQRAKLIHETGFPGDDG